MGCVCRGGGGGARATPSWTRKTNKRSRDSTYVVMFNQNDSHVDEFLVRLVHLPVNENRSVQLDATPVSGALFLFLDGGPKDIYRSSLVITRAVAVHAGLALDRGQGTSCILWIRVHLVFYFVHDIVHLVRNDAVSTRHVWED